VNQSHAIHLNVLTTRHKYVYKCRVLQRGDGPLGKGAPSILLKLNGFTELPKSIVDSIFIIILPCLTGLAWEVMSQIRENTIDVRSILRHRWLEITCALHYVSSVSDRGILHDVTSMVLSPSPRVGGRVVYCMMLYVIIQFLNCK
jgi:hypothetical protein